MINPIINNHKAIGNFCPFLDAMAFFPYTGFDKVIISFSSRYDNYFIIKIVFCIYRRLIVVQVKPEKSIENNERRIKV